MTQEIALHGTRLVRVLSELLRNDVAYPPPNPVQQLGRLVTFGESEQLFSLHAQLSQWEFEPVQGPVLNIRAELLNTRLALVQRVATSFVAGSGSRIRLPSLSANTPISTLSEFAPYHRFYAAHQREFEAKIQTLECTIRDTICGHSLELAQLATLDEGVRGVLANHIRTLLAGIPKLLGQHFNSLLQQHRGQHTDLEQSDETVWNNWSQPGAWLDIFFQDMQGLLLAELELRLRPLLGLVEAVEEQTGNNP